jgi:tetratricopeptide (TPR) repeat protein
MNRRREESSDRLASQSLEYLHATREIQSGNIAKARELSTTLANRFPDAAVAWSLKAAVAVASGDFKSALVHITEANRLDPDNAGILAHKANTLAVLRKFPAARAAANQAFDLGSDHADALATLGTAYTKIGDFKKSLECFQKAVDHAPDSAGHQYNLGTALRFAGNFAAAERCFDRTIELRPRDYETFYARSGLRTQTVDKNHVAELEERLNAGRLSWRDEMLLCYSLAKELEDLAEWDRSFAFLKRGADCRRANIRYDVGKDREKMKKIADAFTSQKLASNATGSRSSEPIFILGLPRAGSTLVERILSSHGAVTSAGELQNFAIELMRPIYAAARTTQIPIDALIDKTLSVDFDALGSAYLESTRHSTGGTMYFTDKMPLNFLYVGLIHLALPNSKIIHVYRDPMDACYAMYKMIFKGAYPFSYDLDDLARYYIAYDRLMRHWNECLPGRLLNIRYEDLISGQESVTRRLLDYCGLEWQEQCMSFHKLETAATTASAVEVRSPIYSSSVNKWKNYRVQLSDLRDHLREHGIFV